MSQLGSVHLVKQACQAVLSVILIQAVTAVDQDISTMVAAAKSVLILVAYCVITLLACNVVQDFT